MSASLKFGWESVVDIRADPDISDIVALWEEGFLSLDSPDLDWGRMIEAEKSGQYRVWTARKSGKLVGLIEWYLFVPFHYRKQFTAVDGGHFKIQGSCNIWAYQRMWQEALEALRGLGVSVVRAHDNPATPMDPFFTRLGFMHAGQTFVRKL